MNRDEIKNIVYPIAGVQKMKGFSLCDLNERNRMNAIFLLLRAFETANEVGAKKVLITTGRDTDECDREKALEQFMKSMERLLPEAENFGRSGSSSSAASAASAKFGS